MRWLKACALFLWYGLALFVVLLYADQWARSGIPGDGGWVAWSQSLLGLLILVGLFVLLHLATRELPHVLGAWRPAAAAEEEETPTGEGCEFYPSASTLLVGGWLVAFALVDLLALLAAFTPPDWWTAGTTPFAHVLKPLLPGSQANRDQLQDLLVTMFAAGIGSSITAILGYLEHACIKRDFRRSYVPWYFARPLMGMLMGVIFYFVLKGGLLAVLPADAGGGAAAQIATSDLNQFTLAGLGTMVGLFSKNALEKLREVFNTLFSTQRDFVEELEEAVARREVERHPPVLRCRRPGRRPARGGPSRAAARRQAAREAAGRRRLSRDPQAASRGGGTNQTGQRAPCSTPWATSRVKRRATRSRVCSPITIRSGSSSAAARKIAAAGRPASTRTVTCSVISAGTSSASSASAAARAAASGCRDPRRPRSERIGPRRGSTTWSRWTAGARGEPRARPRGRGRSAPPPRLQQTGRSAPGGAAAGPRGRRARGRARLPVGALVESQDRAVAVVQEHLGQRRVVVRGAAVAPEHHQVGGSFRAMCSMPMVSGPAVITLRAATPSGTSARSACRLASARSWLPAPRWFSFHSHPFAIPGPVAERLWCSTSSAPRARASSTAMATSGRESGERSTGQRIVRMRLMVTSRGRSVRSFGLRHRDRAPRPRRRGRTDGLSAAPPPGWLRGGMGARNGADPRSSTPSRPVRACRGQDRRAGPAGARCPTPFRADLVVTLAVLAIAMVALLTERLSPDLVALLVVVTLGVTGVLTPQETFSGFSQSAVITILAIFILAEGLRRAGVAERVGDLISRLAGEERAAADRGGDARRAACSRW